MDRITEHIREINSAVNSFAWGEGVLILLIGTGIACTFATNWFQVKKLPHWLGQTVGALFSKRVRERGKDKGALSQLKTLCAALSATIGTGNIAGVSAAICIGGPGAVFWMWVAAFFGMMTHFCENVLGIYYRRKNRQGEWSGGAVYYLKDGLGSRKGMKPVGNLLAGLFALFTIFASFGIGNMSQINKITLNVQEAFFKDIDAPSIASVSLVNWIIGIVLMVIAGFIVRGGLQRIASFSQMVVPVMAMLYAAGALVIIILHWEIIGEVFAAIFRFAFSPQAAAGGTTGAVLQRLIDGPIINGCKRGVFSNEAGLGSSVMFHANSNVREPVRQGLWGMLEVFFDTIIVCTMTALVVLSSGAIDLNTGLCAEGTDDVTLVAKSFSNVFGTGGEWFVTIVIILFAFTTVVGWSQYGAKSVEYLIGIRAVKPYRYVFVVIILFGSILESSLAWDISDTFNGLMMIPNLVGILALLPHVARLTKNYVARRILKKDISPLLSYDPYVQEEYEPLVRQGED